MNKLTKIYTDGSSRPHTTKCGGWATVIGYKQIIYGHLPAPTTNNVAELMGVLVALNVVINSKLDNVEILSDSRYCVDGFNSWMEKWDKNNTVQTKKNPDLWNHLINIKKSNKFKNKTIKVSWVKGHGTSNGNKLADQYANNGAENLCILRDVNIPHKIVMSNCIDLETFINC